MLCVLISLKIFYVFQHLHEYTQQITHFIGLERKQSGPSCSKLTTSLVNDSLKFRSSDTQKCRNFLLKKCE